MNKLRVFQWAGLVCQQNQQECFKCPLRIFNCGKADCREEIVAICKKELGIK